MTVQLITTNGQLEALAGRLSRETRIAIDTEAASFHRYTDRVYLVQVSSGHESAVIDPLAVTDLAPIGAILADPAVEVVFHDADYDLRSFDRDYGFRARNVFDTRIAAHLLGEPGVGLGALLLKHFGITLNKKLQRADWSLRPLTGEMLDYASADTSHLTRLRDLLAEELGAKGRMEWAQEEFRRLELVRWNGAERDPDAYLQLKGARTLTPASKRVLQALYDWREHRARALDRATFRVLMNETMLAIAQAAPVDAAALRAVPRIPPVVVERYGAELLDAIGKALAAPHVEPRRGERGARFRPDPEMEARFERMKLMRNERAKELGLEPGVLAANAALMTIVRNAAGQPATAGGDPPAELRAWQRAALGEERIQSALAGPGPAKALEA